LRAGDVAAIWGPQGPYILSVFLYSPDWLMWDLSNPTMQDLSRAAWNYFAGVAANVSTPTATETLVPASE
jgi:hypothetical protein